MSVHCNLRSTRSISSEPPEPDAPVPAGLREIARTEMIMGLPVSIHLRERSAATGFGSMAVLEETLGAAFAVMRRHDAIFSPYLADSMLNAVRGGVVELPEAGPEFAEVLGLGEQARLRTLGAFDVRFDGRLDPSGLVKGWSAERAAGLLAALPVDHYLNAGGDLACAAAHTPWRLGVEHPFDPRGLLTVVAMRDGAMATSGSAHRGAHITDPTTRRPATGVRQVTVIGASLTWADIWATAITARGLPGLLDADDRLIRRCRAGGYEVLAVTDDDEVFASPGFADHQVRDLPRPLARGIAGLA